MAETAELEVQYQGMQKNPLDSGGTSYVVACYPPLTRGHGFSTYPNLRMYIDGGVDQAKDEIAKLLDRVSDKTRIKIQVARGPVRQSKTDDGNFGSYHWNITRVFTIGGVAVKVEQAPADQAPTPPAEGDTPATQGSLQEEPGDDQGPLFPDAPGHPQPGSETPPGPEVGETPTREQSVVIKQVQDKATASILASWAINNARETYQYLFDKPPDEDALVGMFNDMHRIAIRYIRLKQHLDDLIQRGNQP